MIDVIFLYFRASKAYLLICVFVGLVLAVINSPPEKELKKNRDWSGVSRSLDSGLKEDAYSGLNNLGLWVGVTGPEVIEEEEKSLENAKASMISLLGVLRQGQDATAYVLMDEEVVNLKVGDTVDSGHVVTLIDKAALKLEDQESDEINEYELYGVEINEE